MNRKHEPAIFRIVCFLVLIMNSVIVSATHQRAAEITYRHITGLTYEITLISYTFTPSPANAFRDFLLIDWGDGSASEIPRIERFELPDVDNISYNRYLGQHSFPGPGVFKISCEDPNRNGNVVNIPNSINVPLFVFSELMISPFIGGYNDSPVLLLPPIDNGCVDQPFYHNPGAYDADGDSLSYRLINCYGMQGQPVPGYSFPAASVSFRLDSVTGDLNWDSPIQQGEYNIAILIEEWRKGLKIGSILRDMQINIVPCDNEPPVIEALHDTCVEAGKSLVFDVKAYDPDSGRVTLTGTGGPMILKEHPAFLQPNPATGLGHTKITFNWATTCQHVSRHPYQMFFKAIDDGTPVSLVDIKSMKIKVIGPAPKNLNATPLGNTITLEWDNYGCQNATGYLIYRKSDSTGFQPGYCQTGVPSYLGYSLIAILNDITVISFIDNGQGAGLSQGVKYCYLLVAFYADKAESYASNEACARLKKDRAVITNVSVNYTSISAGSIYLAWSKPTEIDTLQAPGPYQYIVFRSPAEIPDVFLPIDTLYDLNDTIITDTLLNTSLNGYRYRVDLYNNSPGNRFLIGPSQVASSIFIRFLPTDKKLRIYWNNDVPWNNHSFTIYRKNQTTSVFDSIGSNSIPSYTDQGLRNGTEYCYKIKSIGNYSTPGYVNPIINFSQIGCSIPVDNIPPCPPELKVVPECELDVNHLTWKNGADSCSADIIRYYFYYSPVISSPFILLDSIDNHQDTMFNHFPGNTVIGCYKVKVKDSTGNMSSFSNIFCVDYDSCRYKLPNVFTPNGDTKNDLFVPFYYSSVDHIDMTIVNRWGRVVFTTQDPGVNWDGREKNTHQPCSDGVYFYVCDVYVITLDGLVKQTLKGSVSILR